MVMDYRTKALDRVSSFVYRKTEGKQSPEIPLWSHFIPLFLLCHIYCGNAEIAMKNFTTLLLFCFIHFSIHHRCLWHIAGTIIDILRPCIPTLCADTLSFPNTDLKKNRFTELINVFCTSCIKTVDNLKYVSPLLKWSLIWMHLVKSFTDVLVICHFDYIRMQI